MITFGCLVDIIPLKLPSRCSRPSQSTSRWA